MLVTPPQVEESHGEAAQGGQSSVPSLEDSVETHFICFACAIFEPCRCRAWL